MTDKRKIASLVEEAYNECKTLHCYNCKHKSEGGRRCIGSKIADKIAEYLEEKKNDR